MSFHDSLPSRNERPPAAHASEGDRLQSAAEFRMGKCRISAPLSSLVRRLDRAQEAGRGLNFTPEDLNALVSTGAYRTLADAAIRQKEDQCHARNAQTRSTKGEISNFSVPARTGGISKSFGTMPLEDANGALQRALTASGKAD